MICVAAVFSEQIQELFDRLAISAGVRPHQPAGVMVDHDREVSLALANRDLIKPQALKPGEQVALGWASAATRSADPADRSPRDPHQIRHRRLARVDRQPRDLIFERRVNPASWRAHGTAATTTP